MSKKREHEKNVFNVAVRRAKTEVKEEKSVRDNENEWHRKRYAEKRKDKGRKLALLERRLKRRKKRGEPEETYFNLLQIPPSGTALSPFAEATECERVYWQTVDTRITEIRNVRHEYIPEPPGSLTSQGDNQKIASVKYIGGKPAVVEHVHISK